MVEAGRAGFFANAEITGFPSSGGVLSLGSLRFRWLGGKEIGQALWLGRQIGSERDGMDGL